MQGHKIRVFKREANTDRSNKRRQDERGQAKGKPRPAACRADYRDRPCDNNHCLTQRIMVREKHRYSAG